MRNEEDTKNPYWWFWELLERWRLLVLLPVIVGGLAFGIAHFFLPKWYEAEAEVMPHYRHEAMGGTMANLVSGIMSMGGGGGDYVLPMMVTPSDLWGAIVTSNAVVDTLIYQFNLDVRYKNFVREKLRDEVKDHIDIEVSGEGILKIHFEDKSPEFAAEVANGIIDHLDRINRDLRAGTAGESRQFIGERLHETEIALAGAESTFTAFQKEHYAFSLEDQTRVAIENASQIRAELLVSEVELNVLISSMKSGHKEVEAVRTKIRTLKGQLGELKSGEGDMEPFGLEDIPDLGLEYARLFREMKIQELLYEYLTQQYEQAKIEEMKDVPILQVLSRAKVPEKKARPKRIIIAGLSLLGTLILACVWILGSAALKRMKEIDPVNYRRLSDALSGKKRQHKTQE